MMLDLTDNEINILAEMLRTSARQKQQRAKQVHANDRPDMEASAMRDFELRKKLIAAKSANQDHSRTASHE